MTISLEMSDSELTSLQYAVAVAGRHASGMAGFTEEERDALAEAERLVGALPIDDKSWWW